MRSVGLWVSALLVYAFIGERFVWLSFVTPDPAMRLIAGFYIASIMLLVLAISIWFKYGNSIVGIVSIFRETMNRFGPQLLLTTGVFMPFGALFGSKDQRIPWIVLVSLSVCMIFCAVTLGLMGAVRLTHSFDKR